MWQPLHFCCAAHYEIVQMNSVWMWHFLSPLLKKKILASPRSVCPCEITAPTLNLLGLLVKWLLFTLHKTELLTVHRQAGVKKKKNRLRCDSDYKITIKHGPNASVPARLCFKEKEKLIFQILTAWLNVPSLDIWRGLELTFLCCHETSSHHLSNVVIMLSSNTHYKA